MRLRTSRWVAIWAAASLPALAACQNPSRTAFTGPCAPTVEGASGTAYHSFDEAQQAFTRTSPDGSFSAVLEDVAWLRYEGDEQEVVQKHRAYFDQGYTTFAVTLFTKDFVQPTTETFVLEDSGGARLTARPCTYRGNMGMENERYAARFDVSFRHAITADLEWIRLSRPVCGSQLEWMFPAGTAKQGATCAPPQPVHAGVVTRGSLPKAQPLWHPLNPAPGEVVDSGQPTGKPVNLLSRPAGPSADAPGASAVPPPVFHAPAAQPGTSSQAAEPPPMPMPMPMPMPPPTPAPAPGPDLGAPPSGPLPPPESRSVR